MLNIIRKLHSPFNAQEDIYIPCDRNLNYIFLWSDHKKKFLWASRLWVGIRIEPILGYVPKKREKKEFGPQRVKIS